MSRHTIGSFVVEDLTMPTAMPTVFVNAGNDGPPNKPRTTGISVMGENFPPGTVVNIKAAGRRGTALVGADGNFDWDFSVRPPLGCGATVQAVVHGSERCILSIERSMGRSLDHSAIIATIIQFRPKLRLR